MPQGTLYQVNTPKVTSQIIDGEAIMINLESGNYYNLNTTGTDIWDGIEKGLPTSRIVAQLIRRYDAGPGMIEDATAQLIEQLKQEDLVCEEQIQGDSDSQPEAMENHTSNVAKETFVVPVLERYTDLQDLLLLDPIHEVDEHGWPSVKDKTAR